MSMLTKKYNETEMLAMLSKLLTEPDEYIETAVYCMFHETGFMSGGSIPGYAAITSKNRFIGCKMALLNTAPVWISMDFLRKIKISNALLGHKSVYMEFKSDKTYKIKIQLASKIYISKFPNQERNVESMLEILRAKQDMLNLEM
ncbi:MAG: hypothetical protein K2H01_08170 [Ruminococcus sp.]|nr:hypothetical protein [Ruminococcus sp.]